MPIIVKHKDELTSTNRSVETNDFSATRLLLREDGVGVTVTDVTYRAAADATYQYRNHIELGYVLEGEATLEDIETGEIHHMRPGSLWALPNHERFRWIAAERTRLISIFVPALVGSEIHDDDGWFPLM